MRRRSPFRSVRKRDQAYGVRQWSETSGTIAGQQRPEQGEYTIAILAAMADVDSHKNV
jgi:hypothetical protein